MRDESEKLRSLRHDDLAHVLRKLRYALRLFRVSGIAGELVAIVLHHDAAAARGDDDRFSAVRYCRPPCVDITAHESERFVSGIEVERHRAAATGARHCRESDA